VERIIGIDLDNTIIGYDGILHRLAVSRGLIDSSTPAHKKTIRDRVRELTDGEVEWQKLQAAIYGPMIGAAEPMDGIEAFLAECRDHRIPVFIVSHKTEYAAYDDTKTPLCRAAMGWLEDRGFFNTNRFGLAPSRVFFETSRSEKIARIKALNCTLFVDDLIETFLETSFPARTQKILLAPRMTPCRQSQAGITVMTSWPAITRFLFQTKAH